MSSAPRDWLRATSAASVPSRTSLTFAFLLMSAACEPRTSELDLATTSPVEAPASPSSPAPAADSVLSAVLTDADIVDGDTFDLAGTRIRPLGYDSPERGKECGSTNGVTNVYRAATQALRDFALGKVMICTDMGVRDRDGRTVATCRVGTEDLGEHMVALGWARDWPRYSHGDYCEAERRARADKRGIWALTCLDDVWDGRDYVNKTTGREC